MTITQLFFIIELFLFGSFIWYGLNEH